MGFKSLETGSRDIATHAIQQNSIHFQFCTPLNPSHPMSQHMSLHGDAVKDVAFTVDNCKEIYKKAIQRGAQSVREPWCEEDEEGKVWMATVKTYGDLVHTFVQRQEYKGAFLPGFQSLGEDLVLKLLPHVGLQFIDHCVGNQPEDEM